MSLERARRICLAMPEASEKISHGEPTFFARKRVFAMFSNNHHKDGHVAVVVPAPPGQQAALIAMSPETYYRPPYVGVSGWVGIEVDRIDEEQLACHIREAWQMVMAVQGKSPALRGARPFAKTGVEKVSTRQVENVRHVNSRQR